MRGGYDLSWLMGGLHVLFLRPMRNYCVWMRCQIDEFQRLVRVALTTEARILPVQSVQRPLSHNFWSALKLSIPFVHQHAGRTLLPFPITHLWEGSSFTSATKTTFQNCMDVGNTLP